MPTPSLGSPITAVVDGIRAVLLEDATLTALITGVFGHLSEAARTNYPYLVLGRRHRANDSGTMGVVGGHVSIQLDGWSNANGPFQIQNILSRVAVLLERRPITVAGFALIDGSLMCEFEEVFDEPDQDRPDERLYHGVQRWRAEIHDI